MQIKGLIKQMKYGRQFFKTAPTLHRTEENIRNSYLLIHMALLLYKDPGLNQYLNRQIKVCRFLEMIGVVIVYALQRGTIEYACTNVF